MSIFYMDFVNGDDTKDGSSWANAWKTFTAGATAGRTAPGDVILIAKTPDEASLGCNVSMTFGSSTGTLAAAKTANVTLCENPWTSDGGADVECDTTSALNEGSYSVRNKIKAAFGTGLAAHFTITEADLSAFQKLSFALHTNVEIAASSLRIDLCSDTAGATAVDSFTITNLLRAGRLYHLTIDKGAALGASIKSVALTVLSDLGGSDVTIRLDNIIAANSLHLKSVIGKTGGPWFPIRSIDGTTVIIGGRAGSGGYYNINYFLATEAFAAYCCECAMLESISNVGGGADMVLQEAGTSAQALITYKGGINPADDEQDGHTWLMPSSQTEGYNGYTYGLWVKHFTRFENISLAGFQSVFATNEAVHGVQLKNVNAAGCTQIFNLAYYNASGWRLEGTMKWTGGGSTFYIGPGNSYLCGGWGGDADVSVHNIYSYSICNIIRGNDHRFTGKWTFSTGATTDYGDKGVQLGGHNLHFREIEVAGHKTALDVPSSMMSEIGMLTVGANVGTIFSVGSVGASKVRVGNLAGVTGTPTEAAFTNIDSYNNACGFMDDISFDRYKADGRYKQISRNGVISDHITGGQSAGWAYGGTGLSLYFNPSSVSYPLIHSFWIPVGTAAGQQLSMQVIKTSSAANCTLKVSIQGCGVDIAEEAVTLTDEWSEYQATAFTPTFAGFIRVILEVVDGSTTGDVGVDDIQVLIPA